MAPDSIEEKTPKARPERACEPPTHPTMRLFRHRHVQKWIRFFQVRCSSMQSCDREKKHAVWSAVHRMKRASPPSAARPRHVSSGRMCAQPESCLRSRCPFAHRPVVCYEPIRRPNEPKSRLVSKCALAASSRIVADRSHVAPNHLRDALDGTPLRHVLISGETPLFDHSASSKADQ